MPADFWDRLVHLEKITLTGRVENVEQFLDFLRNRPNVRVLNFRHSQPQDLFNQLAAHCSSSKIQTLLFDDYDFNEFLDLTFLFKFEYLTKLWIKWIDANFILKLFEELKFLRNIKFNCKGVVSVWSIGRDLNGLLCGFRTMTKTKTSLKSLAISMK